MKMKQINKKILFLGVMSVASLLATQVASANPEDKEQITPVAVQDQNLTNDQILDHVCDTLADLIKLSKGVDYNIQALNEYKDILQDFIDDNDDQNSPEAHSYKTITLIKTDNAVSNLINQLTDEKIAGDRTEFAKLLSNSEDMIKKAIAIRDAAAPQSDVAKLAQSYINTYNNFKGTEIFANLSEKPVTCLIDSKNELKELLSQFRIICCTKLSWSSVDSKEQNQALMASKRYDQSTYTEAYRERLNQYRDWREGHIVTVNMIIEELLRGETKKDKFIAKIKLAQAEFEKQAKEIAELKSNASFSESEKGKISQLAIYQQKFTKLFDKYLNLLIEVFLSNNGDVNKLSEIDKELSKYFELYDKSLDSFSGRLFDLDLLHSRAAYYHNAEPDEKRSKALQDLITQHSAKMVEASVGIQQALDKYQAEIPVATVATSEAITDETDVDQDEDSEQSAPTEMIQPTQEEDKSEVTTEATTVDHNEAETSKQLVSEEAQPAVEELDLGQQQVADMVTEQPAPNHGFLYQATIGLLNKTTRGLLGLLFGRR